MTDDSNTLLPGLGGLLGRLGLPPESPLPRRVKGTEQLDWLYGQDSPGSGDIGAPKLPPERKHNPSLQGPGLERGSGQIKAGIKHLNKPGPRARRGQGAGTARDG